MNFIDAKDYWPNQHEGQLQWIQISVGYRTQYRNDGWLISDYVWHMRKDRLDGLPNFYYNLGVL